MTERDNAFPERTGTDNNDAAKARRLQFLMEALEARRLMSVSAPLASKLEANRVARFEAAITIEVERHLAHIDSSAFQSHIAHQQALFAEEVAKSGGTYTPILFDDLVATATTDKAEKLATKIDGEITAFQAQLTKLIKNNSKQWAKLSFQTKVANKQARFAARIAKEGGSYTPVSFQSLIGADGGLGVGTGTIAAPTLTATTPSATQINLS
jgi:hypothetical protein